MESKNILKSHTFIICDIKSVQNLQRHSKVVEKQTLTEKIRRYDNIIYNDIDENKIGVGEDMLAMKELLNINQSQKTELNDKNLEDEQKSPLKSNKQKYR